jgi:hypothetical protein
MRILSILLLSMAAAPAAWAADLSLPSDPAYVKVEERVVVRPVRRVVRTRHVCVNCTGHRLPLGGLRKPYVAHVPLGGLRSACPPVIVRTIERSTVVLRVKG